MTVSAQTPYTKYTCSGTTEFNFTWDIQQEADLKVEYTDNTGIKEELDLTTDYTITFVSGDAGPGKITTVATYSSGYIELTRDASTTQETDFTNYGTFDMEVVEDAFDKAIMLIQQLETQMVMAVGISADTTNFDTILSSSDDTIQQALDTIDDHDHDHADITDWDAGVAAAPAVVLNTAKVTNATHTGEVTGDTALTIASNVVDEDNLMIGNAPVDGYLLMADAANPGGMVWTNNFVKSATPVIDLCIPVYDGITGLLIKDSGKTISDIENATHTGEVTGATVLTIADNVVDEANLKLDTGPTDGLVLIADSGASGGMKWGTIAGTGDVVGPGASTDDNIATFDGTTGKLIQDGGKTIAELTYSAGNNVTISSNAFSAIAPLGAKTGGDMKVTAAGNDIKIQPGYYELNGKWYHWNSELTFTIGSSGSNSSSEANPTSADMVYVYIDESALPSSQATALTAANFIGKTTEPAWSASKHAFYDGDDRLVGAFYHNGTNLQIQSKIGGVHGYSYAVVGISATNMNQSVTFAMVPVAGVAVEVALRLRVQHSSVATQVISLYPVDASGTKLSTNADWAWRSKADAAENVRLSVSSVPFVTMHNKLWCSMPYSDTEGYIYVIGFTYHPSV